MKGKVFKISVSLIAVLLISVGFIVINGLWGNPISAVIAKGKASSYINGEYSHLDLEIEDITYNLKNESYVITVRSTKSMDTHFDLNYRDGKIHDEYEKSVLPGKNTMDRFCDEYKKSLLPLIQAKTDNVTNITVIPKQLPNYDLKLDSTFDKSLVKDVEVIIKSAGGIDAKHLATILKITYAVMKENGYEAKGFAITGEQESATIELWNIKPSHIENEELETILQEAITKKEYDGITAFIK